MNFIKGIAVAVTGSIIMATIYAIGKVSAPAEKDTGKELQNITTSFLSQMKDLIFKESKEKTILMEDNISVENELEKTTKELKIEKEAHKATKANVKDCLDTWLPDKWLARANRRQTRNCILTWIK